MLTGAHPLSFARAFARRQAWMVFLSLSFPPAPTGRRLSGGLLAASLGRLLLSKSRRSAAQARARLQAASVAFSQTSAGRPLFCALPARVSASGHGRQAMSSAAPCFELRAFFLTRKSHLKPSHNGLLPPDGPGIGAQDSGMVEGVDFQAFSQPRCLNGEHPQRRWAAITEAKDKLVSNSTVFMGCLDQP